MQFLKQYTLEEFYSESQTNFQINISNSLTQRLENISTALKVMHAIIKNTGKLIYLIRIVHYFTPYCSLTLSKNDKSRLQILFYSQINNYENS